MTEDSPQPAPVPISASSATTPITAPRRYPSAPLVGVGVAVFDDAGRLLLVQRGRPPGEGTWGLPGGLIDLGETLEQAAAREVMEELGVHIVIGDLVTTFESIYYDPEGKIEYHYVVIEYWAYHLRGEPVAQDDVADVAWVELTNLDAYSLSAQQLEVLHKAHAAWRAAPHQSNASSPTGFHTFAKRNI